MNQSRFFQQSAVRYLLLAPLLLALGCGGKQPATSEANAGRAERQRASQGNALFGSIKMQLRSLVESVQMELRPPTVVLDALSSADRQDVLAVLTRRPEAPVGAPANQLSVPLRNARFKALGIRPGDTVKYFVVPDRDTMTRLRETGEADIVTLDSIDLPIAQVLDEHTLLIAGGLPTEITEPSRIEIWRNIDDRMREISGKLGRYVARRDPPLGWQPSPDESVLLQMVERLNQWMRQSGGAKVEGWRAPDLVSTLPESLRADERLAPLITPEAFASNAFASHEGRLLQEAVWARDIGYWASGEGTAPLDQAGELFEWTVRHLQLVEPAQLPPRRPWQLLLHGRATAEGRVWAFAHLCRQRGITVVAVTAPSDDDSASYTAPYTLAGVLTDNAISLFDPRLGLPIPAADGKGIATLSEAQENDSLLRNLDLPESPNPLTAERLAEASVEIVAEPLSLSLRAAAVEARLSGEDRLTLAVDAKVIREQLEAMENVSKVDLWPHPYTTLAEQLRVKQSVREQSVRAFLPFAWRPTLWKGRVLHFRGRLEESNKGSRNVLSDGVNDHREARGLYMSPRVRVTNKVLKQLGSEAKVEIYRDAKTLATYWLGLIAIDEGDYASALRWLENKTLADEPAQYLAGGVRFNRAMVLERLGEIDRAIELLEADDSPQRSGNRLRAKRLREASEASGEQPATGNEPDAEADAS